jgi:4-coumarate--CoA ligase
MTYQVSNTRAQLILVHPSLVKTALAAAKRAGLPTGCVFLFSDEPNAPVEGCKNWQSFLPSAEEGDSYDFPTLSEYEAVITTATVNYSSGTTGLPKGVEVSHHNLIANLDQTIFMSYLNKPQNADTRPHETWIGFLPLYHAHGQLYTIAMAQKLQIPVYIMKKFEYEPFLQTIQDQSVTHLQIALPIMIMFSKRPETSKYDLSSVTDILCSAAPLSKELQNAISKKLDCEIVQGWDMTEVTCGAIHVPGGIVDEFVTSSIHILAVLTYSSSGSVGQLDPNCECMLLDDNGNEVPDSQPGELYFRGPNVCLRYWRNPLATKESISPNGWLKSGDIAIVRNGWFWIMDRKKVLKPPSQCSFVRRLTPGRSSQTHEGESRETHIVGGWHCVC